jgi:hypothetical protein
MIASSRRVTWKFDAPYKQISLKQQRRIDAGLTQQ